MVSDFITAGGRLMVPLSISDEQCKNVRVSLYYVRYGLSLPSSYHWLLSFHYLVG